MATICITGTPGTGKSTLAKSLSKETGFEVIDVNKLIKGLSMGYDDKRKCEIIDTDKLNKKLISLIKNIPDAIIDSHLSHYLPKDKVDLVIVTTCKLPELKKRLEKRGYDKNKVRENLDAEIFGICKNEAEGNSHKVISYDGSKEKFEEIVGIVKNH